MPGPGPERVYSAAVLKLAADWGASMKLNRSTSAANRLRLARRKSQGPVACGAATPHALESGSAAHGLFNVRAEIKKSTPAALNQTSSSERPAPYLLVDNRE